MEKIKRRFIRQLQWRVDCSINRVRAIAKKKHRMLKTSEVASAKEALKLLIECSDMMSEKVGDYVLPENEQALKERT